MTQSGFLDITENDNTHAFMEDKYKCLYIYIYIYILP